MSLEVSVCPQNVVDLNEESGDFSDLENLLFQTALDFGEQLGLEICEDPPLEFSPIDVLLFVPVAAVGEDRIVPHQELGQGKARVEPLRFCAVHVALVPALDFLCEVLEALDQTGVDFRQEILVEFYLITKYSSLDAF